MKHVALLIFAVTLPTIASAGCIGPIIMGECKGTVTPFETNDGGQQIFNIPGSLRPNSFGPGIHQNQYGQAVTLEPQGGGVYGEQLRIKQNAYGPGVHMDQYGRLVRERSGP